MVAIEFAASWNPLTTSKTSAAMTMTAIHGSLARAASVSISLRRDAEALRQEYLTRTVSMTFATSSHLSVAISRCS
jgi:hypothetical protein